MAVEKLTFEMNAVGNAVPEMKKVQTQLGNVNKSMRNATVASVDRPTSAQRVLPITSGLTVHALTLAPKAAFSQHQRRPSLVRTGRVRVR